MVLKPWAGGPGMRLAHLAPQVPLLSFYLPHVDVGPAHSMSPPTSLDGCGFFNSIVFRIPFNSVYDGFE